MRKWYMVKVKLTKENDQGLLKNVTEQYLVDAVSFTEAEAIIHDRIGQYVRGGFQVIAMAIQDIIDTFLYEDSDIWYKCKMTYHVADGETGKEKKVTNYHLVTANDTKEAFDRITESMGNMLVSFEIPAITKTDIMDVFPWEKVEEEKLGNFRPVEVEDVL